MLPNIIIGSVCISTYWLMLAAGACGMYICLLYRRDRFLLSSSQCLAFTLLLTVVGFTGTKVLFILENLEETLQSGITLGGVSFFGAVFLIPVLMPCIGKIFHLYSNQTLDICGPCVLVMIGCMRVGCFLQGCCGGWVMCIGNLCFSWPTQALESIGDFVLLSILLRKEDQNKCIGDLYPLFMGLYGILRFLIEFLRDTPKEWIHLSHGQWFSLTAVLVSIIWLYLLHNNKTPITQNASVQGVEK